MLTIQSKFCYAGIVINQSSCSNCGNIIRFYDMSPVYCAKCKELLLQLDILMEEKNERIEYHLNGEDSVCLY